MTEQTKQLSILAVLHLVVLYGAFSFGLGRICGACPRSHVSETGAVR